MTFDGPAWTRGLDRSRRGVRGYGRARRQVGPGVERLEGRALLALLDVNVSGGTILYDGADPSPAPSDLTIDRDTASANFRYVFTDPSQIITLGQGAQSVGWSLSPDGHTADGPSSVSGIPLGILLTDAGAPMRVTVSYANGDPTPPLGITFNGTPGLANTLTLVGGPVTAETLTYTGPDSGTLDYGGSATARYTFTGLATLNDLLSAPSLNLTTPAGNQSPRVVDGPAVVGTPTTQVASGSVGGFTATNFANKTQANVATLAGTSQSLTVDFTVATPALTSLTITAGGGYAVAEVFNTPSGVDVTASTGPGGTPPSGAFRSLTRVDSVSNVRGQLTLVAPGGAGSVVLDDSARTAPGTYVLGPGGLSGSMPGVILFGTGGVFADVNLIGGSGGNTVKVSHTIPSATTRVVLGTGSAFAADTADIEGNDSPLTVVPNGPADIAVGFQGTLATLLGPLTVAAGPVPRSAVIRLDQSASTAPSLASLTASGTTAVLSGFSPFAVTYDRDGLFQLNLAAGTGNDTLGVDFSNGNPVGAGSLVAFDGGGGTNALALTGSVGVANEIHNATGPGAGVINLDGGQVQYAGLAPVVDAVPAQQYTFRVPTAAKAVSLSTGPLVGNGPSIRVQSTDTPSAFELVDFSNKVNARVNTVSGDSAYVVNVTARPAGLASLALNPGAGDNTVDLQALPGGIAFTLDASDGDDTVTVLAAGLDPTSTYDLDGGPGFDTLIFDSNGQLVGGTEGSLTLGALTVTFRNFEDVRALTLVVLNTNDSGYGSLRYVMTNAAVVNVPLGTVPVVTFRIPGVGPYRIRPVTPLPSLSRFIRVDGTTQPGYAGSPRVEVDGSAVTTPGADGFRIANVGAVITGLSVYGFATGAGVHVDGGTLSEITGAQVLGNFLGVDSAGNVPAAGGNFYGVSVTALSPSTFASGTVIAGNVVSGNTEAGIFVRGPQAFSTLINGNTVGTDPAGNAPRPNGNGVEVVDTSGLVVSANLVSGNANTGIAVDGGTNGKGIVVQSNRVGTNRAGTAALGNREDGIYLKATSGAVVSDNVVAGSGEADVQIDGGTGASLQANFIGTVAGGTALVRPAVANVGLFLNNTAAAQVGTSSPNVLSGHAIGLYLYGAGTTGTTARSNFIGTNLGGTAALPNGTGVVIYNASNNLLSLNVVSGNTTTGVRVLADANATATGNVIDGNKVGTDGAGLRAIPNGFDGLFLQSSGTRVTNNVLSGNGSCGIQIFGTPASGNLVSGNRIGTDFTGSRPVRNARNGVFINNAPGNTFTGNVISGNTLVGVQIAGNGASRNVVQNNLIGTNAGGQVVPGLGNGVGIYVETRAANTTTPNTVQGNTNSDTVSIRALRQPVRTHGTIPTPPTFPRRKVTPVRHAPARPR